MEKSLQEIICDVIKINKIYYNPATLPSSCIDFLTSINYKNTKISKFRWISNVTYLFIYKDDLSLNILKNKIRNEELENVYFDVMLSNLMETKLTHLIKKSKMKHQGTIIICITQRVYKKYYNHIEQILQDFKINANFIINEEDLHITDDLNYVQLICSECTDTKYWIEPLYIGFYEKSMLMQRRKERESSNIVKQKEKQKEEENKNKSYWYKFFTSPTPENDNFIFKFDDDLIIPSKRTYLESKMKYCRKIHKQKKLKKKTNLLNSPENNILTDIFENDSNDDEYKPLLNNTPLEQNKRCIIS